MNKLRVDEIKTKIRQGNLENLNANQKRIYNQYKDKREYMSQIMQTPYIAADYPDKKLKMLSCEKYEYRKVLKGKSKIATIKNMVEAIATIGVPKSNDIDKNTIKISPFQIKMVGQVNSDKTNIELMYNFAKDGYGYVIGLKEGEKTYTMRNEWGEHIEKLDKEGEADVKKYSKVYDNAKEYSSANDKKYKGNCIEL